MKRQWRRTLPILLSLVLLVAAARPVYAEEVIATETEQEGHDHDPASEEATDTPEPESPEDKTVETEESASLPEQPGENETKETDEVQPSQVAPPSFEEQTSQTTQSPAEEQPPLEEQSSLEQRPSQDEGQTEETDVSETTVTEETQPETQETETGETETDETDPALALSLMLAPPAAELQARANSSAPVITVTVAEGGHGDSGMFCEPPRVVVTDADGDLSKITVTDSKGEEEISVGDEKSSVNVDLTGKESRIKIKAEDEAGHTTEASCFIGHQLGGRSTFAIPPTCTEPAKEMTYYICKICGINYYSYVSKDNVSSARGHEYDPNAPITICGDDGGTDSISLCKNGCGKLVNQDGEEVNLTEEQLNQHDWTEKEVPATCTAYGYKYEECSKCGATKGREETSKPLGHLLGKWEITQEGSCDPANPQERVEERRCTRSCCVDKEYIERRTYSVSHNYKPSSKPAKEPTCTEEGYYNYVCSRCGVEDVSSGRKVPIAPLGHTYEDDHDCTTQSQCTRCHTVIPGQKSHNLRLVTSGTQHQWRCTNSGCDYATEPENHISSSGANDCTKEWRCSACGVLVKAQYDEHEYADSYEVSEDGVFHRKMCQHPGCQQGADWTSHTVKGSNDCTVAVTCTVCGYVVREAQPEHTPDGVWQYTIGGHWQKCKNEGCTVKVGGQADHVGMVDDGDCTTDIKCTVCGYTAFHGNLQHSFYNSPLQSDAEGHYRQCRNHNCTFQQREGGHSGGEATCVKEKICEICQQPYGEVDPTHHEKTEIVGIKEATETEEGYTGDEQCLSCHEIVKKGTVIPKLTKECQHTMKKFYDDTACWEECTKCGHTTEKIPHTLTEQWDKDHHWQQCEICEYQTTKIPHTPASSVTDCTKDVVCSECDYIIRAGEASHQFAQELSGDESGHWYICTNAGCTVTSGVQSHNPAADDEDCTTDTLCQDCGYVLVPASSGHDWTEDWDSDVNGHYKKCQRENCHAVDRQPHQFVEEDGLCTTPVFCSVCGWVSVEAQDSHDFGGAYMHNETGHWHVCQNVGCTAVESEEAHKGGKANCQVSAVCENCGQHYGQKDPNVHVGDQEVRDHKDPTMQEEGYSGDLYCLSCGEIVERGYPLDKLPSNHEHTYEVEKSDDTHHWMECECGTRDGYEAHDYGSWLTDDTHHQHICKKCGHVKSESHLLEWVFDSDSHWQKCSICEHTGAKEDHFWQNGGEQEHICEVCAALQPHTWDNGEVTREATCTMAGEIVKTCADCHGKLSVEIPMLDHYVPADAKPVGAKEATEWEEGYTGDYLCAVCGTVIVKGSVIPAWHKNGGSSSSDGSQSGAGSDTAGGGSAPAASAPVAPTPAASELTGPVPAGTPELPSSPQGPAAEAYTPSTPPTGDESTAALWLTLMVLSGGTLTALWTARRKRSR